MTTEQNDTDFEAVAARWKANAFKQQQEHLAFMATQPQTKPCERHQNEVLKIDYDRTLYLTNYNRTPIAGYSECTICAAEREEKEIQSKLHSQGVPSVLLHCTLENWTPGIEEDKQHAEFAAEFANVKMGFLLLLGSIGTGKSHLAVGVMRKFKSALFVRQNDLLRRLRQTYRDSNAVDPIERCQGVGLLVLDEVGLSSGGRDELPLLHEILDHRHGERKPTIITGNMEWQELATAVGERLADRLRESAFRILTIAGESHRPDSRQRYFSGLQSEDLPQVDWKKHKRIAI